MSTELELLTLDQFTDLLVAFAKNLLPEDDYSRGSDNWKRTRVVAGGCTDNSALIQALFRDLWADEAEGTALDRIGTTHGVARNGAIQASGENAGLIRGTVGATWATTDPLVHTSGQRYYPTSSGTIGATGEELVGVIAEDGGEDGNLSSGEVLTWESSLTNIEDEVELQVDIDGGSDQEGDGPYRTRVLNRIAQPAMGGTANDYRQWILESDPSIATAYVWPNRNGQGSVDIAALKSGTGSTRLLDTSERAALLAYVDALRPVSAEVRVLEVVTEAQDVEITLEPQADSAYAKDWNDATPLVVSSWTSSTRTLVFTTDRPDSMAVGHRIVVDGTSGVELVIESLSSTDAVVLVDAKGETPVATESVYSGGPLVSVVRAAVLAIIDALGPRANEFGAGYWVSTLYHSHIFRDTQNSDGVLDSEVVTPASDAEPSAVSYPDDDSQVYLLIPGNIIVRYAS